MEARSTQVLVHDDKSKAFAWAWAESDYVEAMANQLRQDSRHWSPVEIDVAAYTKNVRKKHMQVVPACASMEGMA